MKHRIKDRDNISILIVDDTHANLKVLGNILKNNTYNVAFTDNGFQALEIAEKLLPDLILLDVAMPEMDGFATCLKLKEQKKTKDIPVIFITARAETNDIIKGFEIGAVDYITKPFNAKELLTRIKTHLELQKNQTLLKEEIEEKSRIQKELEKANEKLFKLSNLDGLTGIANRRRFDIYLEDELKRRQRNGSPLSLIMCDVDFFKLYNDEYGHLKGDECLKEIVLVIKENASRPSDLPARYGGEEFSIVLPNTDQAGSMNVAETIRKKLIERGIPHVMSDIAEVVTISLGIATLENPDIVITDKDLIDLADKALYRAKETGRNKVVHISDFQSKD